MKIAYLVFHDATSNDGVIKKVASQIKAWRGQGHDVEVFVQPLGLVSPYCLGDSICEKVISPRL